MGKRQVLKSGIVLAAIFAVAMFAGSGSVMAASKNCSHVGTFYGVSNSGSTWMVTVTPGSSATVGQMVVEWVSWDPKLGGAFSTVVRTTNPLGVWKKVNGKTAQFTWIAYGLDADGLAVYVARASGVSSMVDCDHVNFTYVMELFHPAQDISTDTPAFGSFCGTGTETRMLLVQATCPQ
jgi:hypothetical protein